MQSTWADRLWGTHARRAYLFIASAILLFTCLGGREIWTQEHRWADIVSTMLAHRDFLHPMLNGSEYYDKPLLSYWMMAGLAMLMGKLSIWALRLPSVLAGMVAIGSIYSLGTTLVNRQVGLLAGWMLLTTFYFIFWARTSSTDMLNLGGTLLAVAWYFHTKSRLNGLNYTIFFLILAITALCKGLVGPVVACLAILPDIIPQQAWKKHLRVSFFLSMIPAAIVYVLPFLISTYVSNPTYHENGLMLVYQENILRYFQPFDHKGPLYTYFIFLPIYLLPWTCFFIPALYAAITQWKTLPPTSRWMGWALLLLFVFFTLSGSRRNYYVLPMVPFAILLTANWLATATWNRCAGKLAIVFFSLFFLVFDVLQPLFYAGGGMQTFAAELKAKLDDNKPWSNWKFVLLDPESKVRFYLNLPPDVPNYSVSNRSSQTATTLQTAWPFLTAAKQRTDTIFISRKEYAASLQQLLPNYTVVISSPHYGARLNHHQDNLPIALVPNQFIKKRSSHD